MEKVQWDDLTPLTEDNAGYEPEMEQIVEYAEFIGLVMPQDSKYLYLAREGLKAPLPPFWQACESPQGDLYFRNRKTRTITVQNPLDELYIQKVKQVRQLEAQTNIYSIVEQSALNESSGLLKNRSKAQLKKSDKANNSSAGQPNRVLQRHITEESVYSELPSAERRELQEEPEWKVQQRLQLAELKAKIERFVPRKEQLITEAKGEVFGVASEDLAVLQQLRAEVSGRRAKLQQKQAQRRELQRALQQIRSQTNQHL